MQERVEVWGRYKEQMNEIIKICESFRKRDRECWWRGSYKERNEIERGLRWDSSGGR